MGVYHQMGKYKNYSLLTPRLLRSHQTYYKEKTWTLQEQIYIKLKKIAKNLQSLYPKLSDDFSNNIKGVIEKNIGILVDDLNLMQMSLQKNPYSFVIHKLKTTQRRITEMKNVCNTLQTVSTYEYEFKNLGKIKHALNELEHLIKPTNFERSLEKARVRSKPKRVHAKKEDIVMKTKKKVKEKPPVKSKKKKAISKKDRSTTKLSAKKVLKTKPKSKIKSPSKHKKK